MPLRNRVHVRRKRDDRLAPRRKKIVAAGLGRDPLNLPVALPRQLGQTRKKVVRHVFLMVRSGLDVHKCARQFEKVHPRSLLPCFSFVVFFGEAKRKEGPAKMARGCRLSIALHPFLRGQKAAHIDGRQRTGLRPALQPPRSSYRGSFGGQPTGKSCLGLIGREAPFAQASEADRNRAPGYSWPPHLYQERPSLEHSTGKSQRNFFSPNLRIGRIPLLMNSIGKSPGRSSCSSAALPRPFTFQERLLWASEFQRLERNVL